MGAITTKGRKLHEIEHVPYEQAFLIGDLLTSNITMLAGEPKAGKTNLAAGMSAALLNGADEFLGLPVLRPCRHIVFGLTDDGAEGELRERLHGAVPRDSVTVFPVEDTSQPGYWQGVHDDLVALGADLFVLDNVLGALGDGEDVASSVTARNTIDKLKLVSKSGIPVLAVTHTPKGNGEGLTTASAPIGGRAMAGGVRGVIVLRKSKKGRLMLQVVGAMAEFERSLIKERTRAGLDAARAQGRTGGRPAAMNDDMLTVARARRAKGESVNAIAKALGVSRATLYRHIGEGA